MNFFNLTPTYVTYTAYPILVDLITLTILGEVYKL